VIGPDRPDSADRLLERVADRLRVVGPRLAARDGQAAQDQLDQVRAALQRMADRTAEATGEPVRPVPRLAAHALADQALVLGHDLERASPTEAAAILTELNRLI
jgi:hypothetical protein